MLGKYSAAQRPLAVAAREPERSQLLLGLGPDPGYGADVAELRPGDARATRWSASPTGVTELTDRVRQFDDDEAVLVLAARRLRAASSR